MKHSAMFIAILGAIVAVSLGLTALASTSSSELIRFFGSVLDVIEGLGLFPLTSTVGFLLNIIIDILSAILTKLGNAALKMVSLLSLEHGNNTSVFEMLFSDSLSDLAGWVEMLAFALLLLLYVVNLVRAIVSPVSEESSPIGMTIKAFFAGFFIFNGSAVVLTAANYFNLAFDYLMGNAANQGIDFHILGIRAQSVMSDTFSDVANMTSQLGSLTGEIALIGILLMIGHRLVRFVMEFVQHYVMFHFLIFSSPMAFVLAPFKSTAVSFGKWVRMFVSEGFVLVLNVMLLRLFASAYSSLDTTLDTMDRLTGSGFSGLFIWAFMIYAVLYLGETMDTYLNTLGLSTPEMGSAFMMDAMADFAGLTTTELAMSRVRRFASPTTDRRRYETTQSDRLSIPDRMGQYQAKKGRYGFEKDPVTGVPTAESVQKLLSAKGAVASGTDLGKGVVSAAKWFPSRYTKNMDYSTARLDADGTIHMSSMPNVHGQRMQLAFIPQKDYEVDSNQVGYRTVKIGKEQYAMCASGSGAAEFLSYNPRLRRELERMGIDDKNVRELKVDGERTGVFQTTSNINGDRATLTYYIPLSRYQGGNKALESVSNYEDIGGVKYQVATISAGYNQNKERVVDSMPVADLYSKQVAVQSSEGLQEQVKWLSSTFPTIQESDVKAVNLVKDKPYSISYTDSSDHVHIVEPITKAYVRNDEQMEHARVFNVDNGSCYIDVDIGTEGESTIERETVWSWFDNMLYEGIPEQDLSMDALTQQQSNSIFRDSQKQKKAAKTTSQAVQSTKKQSMSAATAPKTAAKNQGSATKRSGISGRTSRQSQKKRK